MKTIYSITFLAVFMCLMASCKKETLLDGSESIARANALEKELKTQLNDSKDGWILFIKTSDPNVKTATPIILQFDTIAGKAKIRSMYGNSDRTAYFNISAATGMPLLSFSTGSIISDIYEGARTDVTDYFFKVLSISKNLIELQAYRKGNANASEGGAIFKLLRNENIPWATEWLSEKSKVIDQSQFFGVSLKAELTYASGEAFPAASFVFFKQSAGNLDFFKNSYPTNMANKQLIPIEFGYLTNSPIVFLGYHSMFWEVSPGFTPASYFTTGPTAFQRLFKTNYFLIRKINATSIDVFAVDKDGKEIITGTIKL